MNKTFGIYFKLIVIFFFFFSLSIYTIHSTYLYRSVKYLDVKNGRVLIIYIYIYVTVMT